MRCSILRDRRALIVFSLVLLNLSAVTGVTGFAQTTADREGRSAQRSYGPDACDYKRAEPSKPLSGNCIDRDMSDAPPRPPLADFAAGDIYPSHAAAVAAMIRGAPKGSSRSVVQQGFSEPGDGGAGTYDWNPTSTESADRTFVIAPSAGGGRFMLRIPAQGVAPEIAGALGYRASEAWGNTGQPVIGYVPPSDAAAFATLSAYMAEHGGGTIELHAGKLYDLGTTVLIGRHVSLHCDGAPFTQTGGLNSVFLSGITHPPDAQLQVGAGATLENCLVFRTGLPQKPASTIALRDALETWLAEKSQGVSIAGDDARISYSMVVGFNTAVVDAGYARPTIEHLWFDGVNGIALERVHDTARINDNHANNIWAFNLNGRAFVAGVGKVQGGYGCLPGTQTLTVTGGSGTAATLAVTTSRGSVTTAMVATVGDYTIAPVDPVSVSGGGCRGVLVDLLRQGAGYRPGVAYRFGTSGTSSEGGIAAHDDAVGYKVAFEIQNWFGLTLIAPMAESDFAALSQGSVGIWTLDCASNLTVIAPYVNTETIGLLLNHLPENQGGSCNGAVNKDASVVIIGGNVGQSADAPGEALVKIGPHSKGTIIGTMMGGPRGIVFDPGAGAWTIEDVIGGNGYSLADMLHLRGAAQVTIISEGMVLLPSLPKSPLGLPHGALWNKDGIIHVIE